MSNQQEQEYLNLIKNILLNGNDKKDRTGIGTKSIFGAMLKFSLKNNTIPLLTTKKMFTKGIIEELLFFIRGETDTKKLEELGVNIWKGNTSKEFLQSRGLNYKEGEMGDMYGKIWRDWNGFDQLQNAIDLIKKDPSSRRILVSAWNVDKLETGVLYPCHYSFQFNVNDGKLSCMFNMRSTDCGLGLPYNIASYAILTHLVAKLTNTVADELVFSGGDVHIYNNHIDALNEQINRVPYDFPKLNINKNINNLKDVENMSSNDFEIIDYKSHSPIKMVMAI